MADLNLFSEQSFTPVEFRLFSRQTVRASGVSITHSGFGDVTSLEVTVDPLRVTGQSPTLAVKIQHSDDAESWTDMLTFSGLSDDQATDTFDGAVKEHVRVSYTLGGTNTEANFSVSCRVLDATAPSAGGGSDLPDPGEANEGDVVKVEGGEYVTGSAVPHFAETEPGTLLINPPEADGDYVLGIENPGTADDAWPPSLDIYNGDAQETFVHQPDGLTSIFLQNGSASFAVNGDTGDTLTFDFDGNLLISHGAISYQFSPAGVVKLLGLPTANPNVAGQLWNDAGTLKISAG